MSKVIPTTKSRSQILNMICGNGYANIGNRKYVQTTSDPVSTHALYGVFKSEVDYYKEKIKNIGGKYIRVVCGRDRSNDYRVICFALEITPQEALAEKMKKEKEERYQNAYESKLSEIQTSILLNEVGATNSWGQQNFAHYLLDGHLDPLLPFESYVFIDEPTDKDEMRIYDIVKKANFNYKGCVGMVTCNICKMISLAEDMNKKITNEDKRARRRAACLKYGLNFLAKCFEKAN